jgi:hypothetical protein
MFDSSYIWNRLKEASTWQAIVVGLGGIFHFTLPADVQSQVIGVLVFIFVSLGVTKKDAKSPDAVVNPAAVANGQAVAAAKRVA